MKHLIVFTAVFINLVPFLSAMTTNSGPVMEWGITIPGRATVEPTLTNCVLVSGNSGWSLALRANGTLVAWGSNNSGQTNTPSGNQWAHAFAGWRHGIACDRNGFVKEWGTPYGNLISDWEAKRPVITNAIKVAAGDDHSAALLSDGTVVTWGGRALVINQPALSHVKDIASGWYHMAVLQSDGTVVTWGEAAPGQNNTVPASATNVASITAGPFSTFALRKDGTVVGWGLNNYGQCDVPRGLTNVTVVSPGRYHTMAITADGTVHVWGDNAQGQLNVPAGATKAVAAGPSFYQVQIIKSEKVSSSPLPPTGLRIDP